MTKECDDLFVRSFFGRGREGSQLVEGLVNWLTSFEETLPISADKETPINVGNYVELRVCSEMWGSGKYRLADGRTK